MATFVVDTGLGITTNRFKGAGTEPLNVGWGTGAGTTARTDTTLFTEALFTLDEAKRGRDRSRSRAGSCSRSARSLGTDTLGARYTTAQIADDAHERGAGDRG
jgi:hypothetical protein